MKGIFLNTGGKSGVVPDPIVFSNGYSAEICAVLTAETMVGNITRNDYKSVTVDNGRHKIVINKDKL